MFESLVITLREGVEAALVVGIILTYLRKTGRGAHGRAVMLGLGAGIAASLAGAAILAAAGVTEEVYEGWLMLIGSAFVGSMVVWLLKTAKGLRREIETPVGPFTSPGAGP